MWIVLRFLQHILERPLRTDEIELSKRVLTSDTNLKLVLVEGTAEQLGIDTSKGLRRKFSYETIKEFSEDK